MQKKKYTFIDSFTDIGGFYKAMYSLGGRVGVCWRMGQECINVVPLNSADFLIKT